MKDKILVAAHRGHFGGGIVENTIPAFEAAIRCGADTFVTSCPVDFDMTSGKNDKIRVVDLFTLIDGAC